MASQSLSRPERATVRRHVFKACEGCRQQKTRCSGESPCARCLKLSLPCIIRSVARQRRDLPRDSAKEECPNALAMALKSVRIRNQTTGKTAVYGPTSTVALLHLIARQSRANPSPQIGPLPAVIDSELSIDAFNYDPILAPPYQCSLALEGSLAPPLCMTSIPNNILQFFLERYVATAWKLLPVQSPTQLQAVYTSSYRALSANSAPPILYPIILYQLAMGSLCTVQGDLAHMLAQESELFVSAGGYLSDELELQLNILMIILVYAQYHSEIGNFDKAYSMLGHIAGRVYSTGLHIEPRSAAVNWLLRVLVSQESCVCVALGRPPILNPNLTVSSEGQPADPDFATGLFSIIKSILSANYEAKTTFDETCHMMWSTHSQLMSFWEEQEPILQFAHASPSSPRYVAERMSLDMILYQYAVIANFKPFLLYLGYSHIVNREGKSPAASPETEYSTTDKKDPMVEKALEIILASAKNIISMIFGICQRGTVAKDLPMNSFFLQTACVSLVAYGLWCGDPTVVWESIDTGIKCLEELQYQRVGAMRLAAVRACIDQSGLRRD
ncbi:hypothetical protein BJY01DRAFT_241503 [Aspergillus pseudoustus]|uniref:Zn(2)-C6 fungal-type domain-containing protein n=1 Tax=Aspergillus pseudoustus TaxID=1810923 RepID=A0ABR4IEJ4_9EURO